MSNVPGQAVSGLPEQTWDKQSFKDSWNYYIIKNSNFCQGNSNEISMLISN